MKYRIAVRYYASGAWTAESGLHVGGEGGFETNADMALLRDSQDRFFVPGASIAGAARNFLARRSAEFGAYIRGTAGEPQELQLLFGKERMSLLTIFDAQCEGQAVPCVRDGVRINGKEGVAADGAKYDFEVLPAGTTFTMQFLLSLYEEDDGDQIFRLFCAMLAGFVQGDIRLGARTRRGLGRGSLRNLQISRLDMGKAEHVRAWLAQNWASGDRVTPDISESREPKRLTVEADLRLKTSLLIRSGGEAPGGPDMVHLSEQGRRLLTGTSLAGALRHRCERIANTMCPEDAQGLVAGMFGPLESGGRRSLRAGRIWVDEQFMESCNMQVQSRVRIDRFTGGALESALFDEAPLWPADAPRHVRICIHLDLDCAPELLPENGQPLPPPDLRECALLLQAFKDLWLGDLPLGGEVGAGRGVFLGVEAAIRHPEYPLLKFRTTGEDPACVDVLEGSWDDLNTLASALRPQEEGEVTHA
ncbi:MAG TPA: RAMP superfamily CRISPR-associated protein [Candidatus Angelobacter sp.]|nr:RAMP superfamily CRISPR-associated protein [Candidatus Angelobacter sp.]